MSFVLVWLVNRLLMLSSYSGTIGDCFSTNIAISLGAREGNPAEGWVMKLLHDKWVMARCLFGLAGLVGVLTSPEFRDGWVGAGVFALQTAINWYAVVNNILVIRKQKRINGSST